MTQYSQIAPLTIKRGTYATQFIDWSQVPQAPVTGTMIYDFKQQGTGPRLRQVAGVAVDNSKNTNTVIITNVTTLQYYTIYAGEVGQLPIVSPDEPYFTVVCNNDVNPGVGVTQVTFLDFPVDLNIVQAGQQASQTISVQDNQLNTTLQNIRTTVLLNTSGRSGDLVIPTISQTIPTQVQLTIGTTGTQLFSAAVVQEFWAIQNYSAGTPVFLKFGSGTVPTQTNGSWVILAGNSLFSAMFNTAIIRASGITLATASGTAACNIFYC